MKILQNGSKFNILKDAVIIEKLPLGNYVIKSSMFGPYLSKEDDIILPEKIYSNDTDFISHILLQWKSSQQVGVGLIGKKGLGKSFTGNIIAMKTECPIINITENPMGVDIYSLLNSIEQDHVVYIDEFEKIFPTQQHQNDNRGLDSQEKFLSFLDSGSEFKYKRMFIITANALESINQFLKNRPSRLRYLNEYLKLEDRVIKEVVDDLLDNRELIPDLIENLPYDNLNLDSLIQILNECNIHNKPYSTFKKFFNVREEGTYKTFNCKVEEDLFVVNDSIGTIYSHDEIGKYKNKMLYFKKTIPSIMIDKGKISTMAYYYNEKEEAINVPVILEKNVIENRLNYLV